MEVLLVPEGRAVLDRCQFPSQIEIFGGHLKSQANGLAKQGLIVMTTSQIIALRSLLSALLLVGDLRQIWVLRGILRRVMQRRTYSASRSMYLANVLAQKASSIREGVEMARDIRLGDRVKLLGLPDWLIHDLPEGEQTEMRSFVGRCAIVEKIDAYGFFWLGFGSTTQVSDAAQYCGHSFCVPREFIKRDI